MKVVEVDITGPGTIEAVENCTVDLDAGGVIFTADNKNAGFKLVPDDGFDGTTSISMGKFCLPKDTNYVMLEAHSSYDVVHIAFEGESLADWANVALDIDDDGEA